METKRYRGASFSGRAFLQPERELDAIANAIVPIDVRKRQRDFDSATSASVSAYEKQHV
mgnify:CR=1 FL=1